MSWLNSLFERNLPTHSNTYNGLASNANNSVLLKAIFSNSWESVNQKFYTRLAQSIDPIDSAIIFYAELLGSGIVKAKDKKGEDVTDSEPLVKLLNNPNEKQNFSEFIKETCYYLYAHGWTNILPSSKSVGFEKTLDKNTQIYNLDPDHINFNNNSWLWNSKEINFDYLPIKVKKVFIEKTITIFDFRKNSEKPYIGVSRLLALNQQIENFSLALQGKENIIKRSGSILVSLGTKTDDLGLDSSIGTGQFDKDGTPETTTHKKELEKQIRETGLGNDSMGMMFSTLPLKSTPLSSGLENIPFDKFSVEDARQIYNKYNVPKEFQNLTNESAKFQNRDSALKESYQNIVIPLAQKIVGKIVDFYGSENTIYIDYSHLPIFAENEKTKTETSQSIVNLYSSLLEKNQITIEQFNQKLQDYGII